MLDTLLHGESQLPVCELLAAAAPVSFSDSGLLPRRMAAAVAMVGFGDSAWMMSSLEDA